MEDEEKFFDKYFLSQYPRIVSSDFTPTFEGHGLYHIDPKTAGSVFNDQFVTDMLKIYYPTSCGDTFTIEINDTASSLITDVGGSSRERVRWLQFLRNTGQIMFVIAVDEFDEVTQDGTNKLFYATALFCQSVTLFDKPRLYGARKLFQPIVVLSKVDLLELKIKRGVSFTKHFPEFKGNSKRREKSVIILTKLGYGDEKNVSTIIEWIKERVHDGMEQHLTRIANSEERFPVRTGNVPEGKLVTFFELATHQSESQRVFIGNFLKNLKWENDMETFNTIGTGLFMFNNLLNSDS